jgi:hypothetical protein
MPLCNYILKKEAHNYVIHDQNSIKLRVQDDMTSRRAFPSTATVAHVFRHNINDASCLHMAILFISFQLYTTLL